MVLDTLLSYIFYASLECYHFYYDGRLWGNNWKNWKRRTRINEIGFNSRLGKIKRNANEGIWI